MEIFEHEGMRIQTRNTVSAVGDEGMVVECWDITPSAAQGLLFSIAERDHKAVLRTEISEISIGPINRVVEMAGMKRWAGPTPLGRLKRATPDRAGRVPRAGSRGSTSVIFLA